MRILLVLLMILNINCQEPNELIIYNNFEEGMGEAKKGKQDVFLIFDWHGNPVRSTIRLLKNKEIKSALEKYIVIMLYVDDKSLNSGLYRKLQKEKFSTDTQPTYFVLNSDGNTLRGPKGYCKPEELLSFINQDSN